MKEEKLNQYEVSNLNIEQLIEQNKAILDEFNKSIIISELDGKIIWKNQYVKSNEKLLSDFLLKLKNNSVDTNIIETYRQNFEVKTYIFYYLDKVYNLNILCLEDMEATTNGFDSNVKNRTVKYTFDSIIGKSISIKKTIDDAKKATNTDANVVIYGATGTGKELIAQSIHSGSRRRKEKFIAVNCAAVPANLMESIFFGSVKGAYTGAVNKKGLFELASKGTIFLDEINSMPITLQSKLLRVIQEGKVRRLGGNQEILVESRIISALNKNPFDEVKSKKLRMDLLYRLGVIFIKVPSLRERIDDIECLVEYFVKNKSKKLDVEMKPVNKMLYEVLKSKDWEGNVRQLEHVIESSVIMSRYSKEINIEHLPSYFLKTDNAIKKTKDEILNNKNTLQQDIESLEKNRIIYDLEKSNGCRTLAAKSLGISRQNLYKKMKKYNIKVKKD